MIKINKKSSKSLKNNNKSKEIKKENQRNKATSSRIPINRILSKISNSKKLLL